MLTGEITYKGDRIKWLIEKDGGFVVANGRTGRTAYAYPSSPHANDARFPSLRDYAVRAMMDSAERCTASPHILADYDARQWAKFPE